MKRVISISLGSSKRDHAVELEVLGEQFRIERVGTDGDVQKAIQRIQELDGSVDAFGMGGIDLYVQAGRRRYVLRSALPLARAAKKSPIVDGSGLKNTLERRVISYLRDEAGMDFKGRKVLLVSGADRFGMAEALAESGADLVFGDLLFTVGVPWAFRSLKALERAAAVLGPIICRLPISMIYPTGDKQRENKPKFEKYFQEADVIAGDWHFIFRSMPARLDGKTIITNTTTPDDVAELRRRGVATLITTTPELNGRSFGTNVMEAMLIALANKPWTDMQPEDYHRLLDQLNFTPRITQLA